MRKNILSILFIAALLLVAGCTTGTQTPIQVQEEETVPTTEGLEIEETVPETPEVTQEAEIQRQESESESQDTDTVNEVLAEVLTLTGQGDYNSPGGLDIIDVSLTVEEGIVTDLSIEIVQADRTSERYISGFSEDVRELVIGKSLDEIEIPKRVGSSSLTSEGFNEALDQIKQNT